MYGGAVDDFGGDANGIRNAPGPMVWPRPWPRWSGLNGG